MRLLPTLPAIVALAVACSGPTYEGGIYRGDDMAFRIGPVPEGWRELEVDGTLLAFRDDSSSASIAVSGRCGLDGDDVPLKALTQHLFLQFTERELLSQELVQLDGREALRSELLAKLDGVPKRFLIFVLKKDGCVYDFVHVAPVSGADSAGFVRFVHSFATMEPA